MVFRVLAAGDLEGKTHNFEYAFPTLPTLQELIAQVEGVFSREARKTVNVDRLQVYDSSTSQWAELTSGRQLRDGCQVFVFVSAVDGGASTSVGYVTAPASPTDSARQISPPRPQGVAHPSLSPGSPHVPATAIPSTHPHPASPTAPTDVARTTFDFIDHTKTRKLTLHDLQEACRKIKLPVDSVLLDAMFRRADYNEDGAISYAEWCRFSNSYPKLVESVMVRMNHFHKEEAHRMELAKQQDLLAEMRKTADEKLSQYHDCVAALEQQKHNVLRIAEECDEIKSHEEEVRRTHEVIEGDLHAAGDELNDARRDREHALQREAEQAEAMKSKQYEVEHTGARLSEQERAVADTKESIRQLEYELDQAMRTLTKQEQQRAEISSELKARQDEEAHHRNVLAEARTDVQHSTDNVAQVETNVARIRDALRQAEASARDLHHTLHLASQNRDAEERELEKLGARVTVARDEHAASERNVEDQLDAVSAVRRAIDDMGQALEITSQEEVHIITEEWHLHDQRASLEDREVQLGVKHSYVQSVRDRKVVQESSTVRAMEKLAATPTPAPMAQSPVSAQHASQRRYSMSGLPPQVPHVTSMPETVQKSHYHSLHAAPVGGMPSSVPRGGEALYAAEDGAGVGYYQSSLRRSVRPESRASPSAGGVGPVLSATPMPQSVHGSPHSRFSNTAPSPGGIVRGLAEAINQARTITRY